MEFEGGKALSRSVVQLEDVEVSNEKLVQKGNICLQLIVKM